VLITSQGKLNIGGHDPYKPLTSDLNTPLVMYEEV